MNNFDDRKTVLQMLDEHENDLLDKWFEVHNTLPEDDSTFRKSGFRPAHAVSMLITIERSDLTPRPKKY